MRRLGPCCPSMYGEEHRFGFNARPDCLDRALRAAQRAADAAPSSHLSHFALAQAHYFRKEFEAFRNAAERAIALNPRDGAIVEFIGHLLAFAGDWERGCELGERAETSTLITRSGIGRSLSSMPIAAATTAARRAFIPKINMPGNFFGHAVIAPLSTGSSVTARRRGGPARAAGSEARFRGDRARSVREVVRPPELVEH